MSSSRADIHLQCYGFIRISFSIRIGEQVHHPSEAKPMSKDKPEPKRSPSQLTGLGHQAQLQAQQREWGKRLREKMLAHPMGAAHLPV